MNDSDQLANIETLEIIGQWIVPSTRVSYSRILILSIYIKRKLNLPLICVSRMKVPLRKYVFYKERHSI